MTAEPPAGCRKVRYVVRRFAKEAARLARSRGEHVRPYRCVTCGLWHVGHLPVRVLKGKATAKQVYKSRGVA